MDLYGNAEGNQHKAIAGSVLGLHEEVESRLAAEPIYPGDPVFAPAGDELKAFLGKQTASKLTFSALVTGNLVNLEINGVALNPVPFNTDAETTLDDVVQAIGLNPDLNEDGIGAFKVSGEPLVIYVESASVALSIDSATITGGASQGTISDASYTTMAFVGIARHTDSLSFKDSKGFYPKTMEVNIVTHGKVLSPVVAGAAGDLRKAYVILSGDNAGKFTTTSAGNYDCGAIFRSGEIEPGLAFVEVRGAK